MEAVTQLINDLGNFIFIPLIFLIIMKALGRKWGEAVQCAMKVGIGFIALTMTINLMLNKVAPAITGMTTKFGTSLDAIDVGGAATAVMGFGSPMGAIIIPLCVVVNIVMLVLKLTDCINVDVFNLHQNASMGAIVYAFSGNFLYGVLTAALFHVWALVAADLGAEQNERFFKLPKGVSISHPVANTYLIFAYPFNWILTTSPVSATSASQPKVCRSALVPLVIPSSPASSSASSWAALAMIGLMPITLSLVAFSSACTSRPLCFSCPR